MSSSSSSTDIDVQDQIEVHEERQYKCNPSSFFHSSSSKHHRTKISDLTEGACVCACGQKARSVLVQFASVSDALSAVARLNGETFLIDDIGVFTMIQYSAIQSLIVPHGQEGRFALVSLPSLLPCPLHLCTVFAVGPGRDLTLHLFFSLFLQGLRLTKTPQSSPPAPFPRRAPLLPGSPSFLPPRTAFPPSSPLRNLHHAALKTVLTPTSNKDSAAKRSVVILRNPIHSFILQFIHSFIHSAIHSLISFILQFIHSFILQFILQFIHSFCNSIEEEGDEMMFFAFCLV